MKAIVLKQFGGIENFEMMEVLSPKISDFEVLVEIKAVGFNPIDFQMRIGDKESGLLKSNILGREFAGKVLEIGKNVDEFKIGDRVFAYVGGLASNGTYAELIAVPSNLLVKIPDELNYEDVAGLTLIGLTALQCFQRMNLNENSSVFIAGASGSVGLLISKMILTNKIKNLYVTASNAISKNKLLMAGVPKENIINYREIDVLNYFKTQLGNLKFDMVIDLVGDKMSEVGTNLLKVFGSYFDIADKLNDKAKDMLFDKGAIVHNISNYAPSLSLDDGFSNYYKDKTKELLYLLKKHNIELPETSIVGGFSLQTVQIAHNQMEKNSSGGLKLIMKY